MTEFITLWCEWDIGQEGLLFTTKSIAKLWAEAALGGHNLLDDEMPNFEAARRAGLIGYGTARVVA